MLTTRAVSTGDYPPTCVHINMVCLSEYLPLKGPVAPDQKIACTADVSYRGALEKKVADFPVPSRDVTEQTLPRRE